MVAAIALIMLVGQRSRWSPSAVALRSSFAVRRTMWTLGIQVQVFSNPFVDYYAYTIRQWRARIGFEFDFTVCRRFIWNTTEQHWELPGAYEYRIPVSSACQRALPGRVSRGNERGLGTGDGEAAWSDQQVPGVRCVVRWATYSAATFYEWPREAVHEYSDGWRRKYYCTLSCRWEDTERFEFPLQKWYESQKQSEGNLLFLYFSIFAVWFPVKPVGCPYSFVSLPSRQHHIQIAPPDRRSICWW